MTCWQLVFRQQTNQPFNETVAAELFFIQHLLINPYGEKNDKCNHEHCSGQKKEICEFDI